MKAAVSVLLLASALTLVAKEPFQLSPQTEKLIEGGEINLYVLKHRDTEAMFLPPIDWGCVINAEGHALTFHSGDLNATISVEFHFVDRDLAPMPAGQWRDKLAAKYPEAKIVEESKCYASDLEGLGAVLEQGATERERISRRVARVQFPRGAAEFTLTTPGGKLKEYLDAFGGLVTSFRVTAAK